MSKTILHITSSIFGDNGVSTQLTAKIVEQLQKELTGSTVVNRDLASQELPHFNLNTISAIGDGKAELADTLIKELQEADIVVLGAPMYNFCIPTQLKSWIDHIARAGTTFRYTENGAEGLLSDKKVFIATSRGGIHRNQPEDTVVPLLTNVFNFVGLKDIHFIYAEGVNLSGDARSASISKAEAEIDSVVSQYVETVKAEA